MLKISAVFFLALSMSACNLSDQVGSGVPNLNVDSPQASLGAMRSAMSIYYGDMEGQYPADLAALALGGRYIESLPMVGPAGFHPPTSAARNGTMPTDEGGWLYNNVATDMNGRNITINCTHTDGNGLPWNRY